jgi:exonuclease SbcC
VILNRVKLVDFVSHKNSELEFGYGINVIVGPNAAGKTSILDAISFALFNDYTVRGKKENLINSRADRCKASVEFTEGGIQYVIDWSMERNKAPKGSLFRIQNGDRRLEVQGGGSSVVPYVEKTLGIDKSMFLQSIYVRQGEIEDLVTAKPADRKKLISRLLGLEDLESAWNSIRYIIEAYNNISSGLQGELTQRSATEADKQKYLGTSKELAKSIEFKEAELYEVDNKISNLETLLASLKEDKKRFEKLDKEKKILEKDVENDKDKLKKEQSELDNSIKAEEKVKSLESDVGRLRFLEDYVDDLSRKREQELQLEKLKEKVDTIERLENTVRENDRDHQLYLDKEKLLEEKSVEHDKFVSAGEGLKRVLKQIQQLEKEERKKHTDLTKELAKFAKILGEEVNVSNSEALLEGKKKEFQSLVDELDRKTEEGRNRVSLLTSKKEGLDDSLTKLGSSRAELTKCPTCETDLPADRVANLLEKFGSEKAAIEAELKELTQGLKETADSKKHANERLRKVDSLDVEKVRGLDEELNEITSRLKEQKSEVQELEKQSQKLEELDKELAELEAEKRRLKEAFQEFESARRELDKLPSREQISLEMAPIAESLETILAHMREAVSNLGFEPADPDRELKALRLKKQEYDQNLSMANRKPEHEANVTGISHELAGKEEKLKETDDAIQKLGYDEQAHLTKEAEYTNEGKRQGKLKEEIAALTAQKKDAETAASDCEKKLQGLKDKEREKKAVDDFVRLLSKIRDAYGKDGVQKMIRAVARPLLERSARDLFERFNLAYSDIKIDDDYNISVIGPSGEQDIDQISGGERVALAIAFRLAIAQVLSGKVETIIMDEPTTHLDEERRKELVNILSSFFKEGGRIIPQMLIITHHPEIEYVADVIYTVKKEEGYSIAELAAVPEENV